jgi:ATP-dependent HslUV protease ATP-binding subunit HslU
MSEHLTPSRTVAELDKYIIGQTSAKRAVAIALRNRWRRLHTPEAIRHEIMPANILMIGSTGVGKTEIARRLAQLAEAPFVKVEASKYTEVGYVGRDVESMIRDLAEQSVRLVREEHKVRVQSLAQSHALEEVLNLLLPPPTGYRRDAENSMGEYQSYHNTREKFRSKVLAGDLDHREVEIEMTVPERNVHIVGNANNDQMEGITDMLQNMIPKKRKTRHMPVQEALQHFTEEQSQNLIDMDAVAREAILRAQNTGIVFIDEIDKIAGKGNESADVSRQGVQRDLLPIVEGSAVSTKYGVLNTDHVLFIAAGAFHVARPSDLIPELQGRFPIRVELSSLTREDFYRILTEPETALTKQYQALLATEGVTLTFDDESLHALADIAFEVNENVENIGARRLHTLLSNLLDEILYSVPDQEAERSFTVTKAMVQERLANLAKHKDMSHYIL